MPGLPGMIARRATVTGRVQAVGYRYAILREAQRLGLAGWVRNDRDGSVRVHAQGEPDAVAALVRLLAAGPRHAIVRSVDVQETQPDRSLIGFKIVG